MKTTACTTTPPTHPSTNHLLFCRLLFSCCQLKTMHESTSAEGARCETRPQPMATNDAHCYMRSSGNHFNGQAAHWPGLAPKNTCQSQRSKRQLKSTYCLSKSAPSSSGCSFIWAPILSDSRGTFSLTRRSLSVRPRCLKRVRALLL